MIERRPINDLNQWREWRAHDITASRVAAIAGSHPYVTALRLYAEKRGAEFPEPDLEDKVMRRGRWLEPAVAAAVREQRPQWRIEPAKVYLRDPTIRLGASPDFFIHDDPRGLGVLQTKTAAPHIYHRDWNGGDKIPDWIICQTRTEMLLADAAFGAVAVLTVDPQAMDLAIFELERDLGYENDLRAAVRQFWTDVELGQEPDPIFARDAETIKALLPREHPGKTVDLSGNNTLPTLLDERAAICDAIKDAEDRREAIDTELKFVMGDAEIATGIDGWRITFKSTDRAGYTVAPKTVRSLRIRQEKAA